MAGGAEAESSQALEYTPTWIVAVVCSIIVLISLVAERSLHRLGKFLKSKQQDALFEALMAHMLPCKKEKLSSDVVLHYNNAFSPATMSWYLWLFVVIFLLLNVEGWHSYFWMSFLPLILLLGVGAKLEHIITQLAEEVSENKTNNNAAATVKPSDKHFWFGRPGIVLYMIHFILFQNAFEIAFFFWIWSTYGFNSCILEKVGYIIPRLIIGVIVQVLCSYSSLPLYVIVTQMGSEFKQGIFEETVQAPLQLWVESAKRDRKSGIGSSKQRHGSHGATEMQRMAIEALESVHTAEWSPATLEGITMTTEFPHSNGAQISSD